MRCLIVFCHPSETSFGASVLDAARTALSGAGHDVRLIDLYREDFDPVLSTGEWHSYLTETEKNVAGVRAHVDALRWAEFLVLIFPTWMYGPPAMLKGWLERVFLPGVAFEVSPGNQRVTVGRLKHIRRLAVVTTSGSPWWWLRLIRDPCRSTIARGMRHLFHSRCRIRWLQLHDMNHVGERKRKAFLERVRAEFAAPA